MAQVTFTVTVGTRLAAAGYAEAKYLMRSPADESALSRRLDIHVRAVAGN